MRKLRTREDDVISGTSPSELPAAFPDPKSSGSRLQAFLAQQPAIPVSSFDRVVGICG